MKKFFSLIAVVFILLSVSIPVLGEEFVNTVSNVKLTKSSDDSLYVDVYIKSSDRSVKPQLSTRKYGDNKQVIDLFNVTNQGGTTSDPSVQVGNLKGGTARVVVDLDSPSAEVKKVRYHYIDTEPAKPTPKPVVAQAEPVNKPAPKPESVKKAPAVAQKPSEKTLTIKPTPKKEVPHEEPSNESYLKSAKKIINPTKKQEAPKEEPKQETLVAQAAPQEDHGHAQPVEKQPPEEGEQLQVTLEEGGDDETIRVLNAEEASKTDFGSALMTVGGALIVLLPLILLTLWVINQVHKSTGISAVKGFGAAMGGDNFKILASTNLGQGKGIHLVEIKGRQLVIGSTNNSINILTEFSEYDEFLESQKEGPGGKSARKGRPNVSGFSGLYKDYQTKISDEDLEDEYQ